MLRLVPRYDEHHSYRHGLVQMIQRIEVAAFVGGGHSPCVAASHRPTRAEHCLSSAFASQWSHYAYAIRPHASLAFPPTCSGRHPQCAASARPSTRSPAIPVVSHVNSPDYLLSAAAPLSAARPSPRINWKSTTLAAFAQLQVPD